LRELRDREQHDGREHRARLGQALPGRKPQQRPHQEQAEAQRPQPADPLVQPERAPQPSLRHEEERTRQVAVADSRQVELARIGDAPRPRAVHERVGGVVGDGERDEQRGQPDGGEQREHGGVDEAHRTSLARDPGQRGHGGKASDRWRGF